MMINLGIIGTGGMANGHAQAYSKISGVKMTACCDIVEERAAQFAVKWKIPAYYTNYKEMLEKEKLDGVSVVTPDSMHAGISLDVIGEGIHILCEKPLATNLVDAKKMAAAAKKKSVINMLNFSWRNYSNLQEVSLAVSRGEIGKVVHVEGSFLQSWLATGVYNGDIADSPRLVWRLSTRDGNAGTLSDVGCHLYDAAEFLCGGIDSVFCTLKTFDKEIPGNRVGDYILDANDSYVSNVVFTNGAIGSLHATRWAHGYGHVLRLRVFGTDGAVEVELKAGSADEYRIIQGKKAVNNLAWKKVSCKPKPTIYSKFVEAVRTGKKTQPDFEHGARIQACLHYSLLSQSKVKPMKIEL
jgi:predicted dehydrogenase